MIKVTESATFNEMLQAAAIMRNFPDAQTVFSRAVQESFRRTGRLRPIGEGSSRKFPGRNLEYLAATSALENQSDIRAFDATEAEQFLRGRNTTVLSSYSGTTNEVLNLARILKEQNRQDLFAITSNPKSELGTLCSNTRILACGKEAVAATKSVVEQALSLQHAALVYFPSRSIRQRGAEEMMWLLTGANAVDARLMDRFAKAGTIYIAGPNNGVGDELSLKLSETTTRAVFQSGTDLFHGYQETMQPDDAVILIDPPALQQDKFRKTLAEECGLPVLAIATQPTQFPTIIVPDTAGLTGYFELAAGWRTLIEVAQRKGVDIDHPKRVQKEGNPAPVAAPPGG